MDQGGPLRFSGARNLDAGLSPSPLDEPGTVETPPWPRGLAAPDVRHTDLMFSSSDGREALRRTPHLGKRHRLRGLLDCLGHLIRRVLAADGRGRGDRVLFAGEVMALCGDDTL